MTLDEEAPKQRLLRGTSRFNELVDTDRLSAAMHDDEIKELGFRGPS
jgi:hypothetical protein